MNSRNYSSSFLASRGEKTLTMFCANRVELPDNWVHAYRKLDVLGSPAKYYRPYLEVSDTLNDLAPPQCHEIICILPHQATGYGCPSSEPISSSRPGRSERFAYSSFGSVLLRSLNCWISFKTITTRIPRMVSHLKQPFPEKRDVDTARLISPTKADCIKAPLTAKVLLESRHESRTILKLYKNPPNVSWRFLQSADWSLIEDGIRRRCDRTNDRLYQLALPSDPNFPVRPTSGIVAKVVRAKPRSMLVSPLVFDSVYCMSVDTSRGPRCDLVEYLRRASFMNN